MPSFKTRSQLPEKMDNPAAPEADVRRAMREIERINKWLGGNNVVLDALEKLRWKNARYCIMDVGCGGGNILRLIADWAIKKNREVALVGVDLNPKMIKLGKEQSSDYPNISYRTASVFDKSLKAVEADIVTCSLFAHHFDDADLVVLLRHLDSLSKHAVIINDLHRHWLAYHAIKILTSVFSSSEMVQYDAPLSVARALTRTEWTSALLKAGISNYSIRWRWAWRWEIIIEK